MTKNDKPIKLELDTTESNYTSQSEALLQLFLGRNVFLSGPAGSGKSYVIRKYCEMLREIDPEVRIYRTSTTGLSALNIQGETIHSYSGQGISSKPYEELKKNHDAFKGLWFTSKSKIMDTDVLIIDEISMFSEAQLDFLYSRLHDILKSRLKHVQIIVAGDFTQLPPVADRKSIKAYGSKLANYCYGTESWNKLGFIDCYLDRIYRAKDKRLQFVLDGISKGYGNDPRVIKVLQQLPQQKAFYRKGVPVLMPTNREVATINNQRQKANTGNEYYFETVYDNTKARSLAENMAKARDVYRELRLRVGDTIMITTNDNDKEPYATSPTGGPTLKNGMIGTFVGLSGAPGEEHAEPKKLSLNSKLGFQYTETLGNGETRDHLYLVSPKHEILMNAKDEPVAGFTQFPIKLAYAISIHKSQGQTFTKLAIDLRKVWQAGLGYVALSRATGFDGITLINEDIWSTPWNQLALQVDKRSLHIKRAVLNHAKLVREKYTKDYKVASFDIAYLVHNRRHLSYTELIKKAKKHKKELEQEQATLVDQSTREHKAETDTSKQAVEIKKSSKKDDKSTTTTTNHKKATKKSDTATDKAGVDQSASSPENK